MRKLITLLVSHTSACPLGKPIIYIQEYRAARRSVKWLRQ